MKRRYLAYDPRRNSYEIMVRNERIVRATKWVAAVVFLLFIWGLTLTPCPANTFC